MVLSRLRGSYAVALWEELVGGMPEATTNPAEMRGIGLALDWQFAYTADDAYAVDFTIDDVTLVE